MARTREGGVNVLVCLPEDVKTWLVAHAMHNFTSTSAKILKCVRAVQAQEKVTG